MAASKTLKRLFRWLNAEDDAEDAETMEPGAPLPPLESPPKRHRGPLMLRGGNEGGMEIRHPRNLDERMTIGMDLKLRRMVTLDLTKLPDADARHFLEFIYGVVFALDATAEKVHDGVYLLAPHGVSVRNDAEPETEPQLPKAVAAGASSRGHGSLRDGQEELFWQGGK